MTDDHLNGHLVEVFGQQAFFRAKEILRRERGLVTLATPADWEDAFARALCVSLPEKAGQLYLAAQAAGVESLMIDANDETGAGRVFHALYGRYFESHGRYDLYEASVEDRHHDVVVSVSRERGLRLVGFAPFRGHSYYAFHYDDAPI